MKTNRNQYLKYFPVSVIRVDCQGYFTDQELADMVSEIDRAVDTQDNDYLSLEPTTVPYQSKPILFDAHMPEHWKKVKKSFDDACLVYLEQAEEYKVYKGISTASTRAWWYKTWKSMDQQRNQFWHNHSPAFLTGVFYLKIPDQRTDLGTKIMDPRFFMVNRSDMLESVEHTWAIFPGWLPHQPPFSNTETPRYVIAAECYAVRFE